MAKVALFYLPAAEKGGVATAFRALAALLEKHGVEVKVLVPYADDIARADIPSRYIVGCVRRRRLRCRVLRRAVNLFNFLTRYRFFFWGVPKVAHDVLVVYQAYANVHWWRYSRKPAFAWLHGVADAPWPTLADRIWSWSFRQDFARYAAVVAVADEVADSYVRRYALAKRPRVIANLTEADQVVACGLKPAPPPLRSGTRLAFVGRISQEKGLRRLIAALARLRREGRTDWSLDIVGDGDERLACERLAAAEGLGDFVRFAGVQENPQPFLRAADLLVVPSYHEGCPCVIAEALLNGTAVLATDCGGTRTALRGGRWGRLVENTDEGLCEGLRQALDDSAALRSPIDFAAVAAEIRRANAEAAVELEGLFALDGAL